MIKKFGLMVVSLIFCGCTTALPVSENVSRSPWKTFESCKDDYNKIVPFETTTKDLKELGFDPFTTPNIKILNHLDIMERFHYDPDHKREFPKGILGCIKAQEKCHAYDITVNHTFNKRTGPFISDYFNFERTSVSSGWIFKALVIVEEDLVVFKLWSGTPQVNKSAIKTNPLGPMQGVGGGDWGSRFLP